jgi:protein-L-isoaspartate(D-aspartate) O-methyltransferase
VADSIEEARRRYAEELRFTAKVGSRAVIEAFAIVPRERFFGPGPWRVLSPMAAAEYWTTEDADPRHVYHDVLIAIDEERRLNNGQPSLWARLYDQLELTRELSPNLGDGLRDQAAAVWDCEDAEFAATSIPSVNLTP